MYYILCVIFRILILLRNHYVSRYTHRETEIIIYGSTVNVMANQTADYHGDIYRWNRTVLADEGDVETEYYLPNWTDLVLAGLFTMLIIVTIVSISIT